MKKVKFIVIQVALFLILFFWDITSIFSDRKEAHPVQGIETEKFDHQINNHLSNFEGTERMEKTIEAFLERYKIKGASVAVTQHGRLVYAKGFGYADVGAGEPVEPRHMFRVASISKLITAVAVMRLVEEGKIGLEETVFGKDGILNDSVYLHYRDPRVEDITIHHLLTHQSGWSRYYGDPLFMPHVVSRRMKVELPVSAEDVIAYTLQRKLNYRPGTRYSYSNVGYAMLGEVIEKISGLDYEDYVNYYILNPLGIENMRIGHGYLEGRASNEVRYYEYNGSGKVLAFDSHEHYGTRVYGGNDIELLAAAGGWIATPVDIMKLVVAIDGFKTSPDILMPETIDLMTDYGRSSRYSMIGWKGTDGNGTWWRTGTLTGTSALVVRQEKGLNWVIVTNTTTWKRARIHSETSRMMFQAMKSVKEWPQYDLFDYQSPGPLPSKYLTRID